MGELSLFHIWVIYPIVPLYLTRNIEIEMLLNGWAWVLERYGPDEIYLEALEIAQRNKRGIWAYDDNVHPWTFKGQKYNDPSTAKKSKLLKNVQRKAVLEAW